MRHWGYQKESWIVSLFSSITGDFCSTYHSSSHLFSALGSYYALQRIYILAVRDQFRSRDSIAFWEYIKQKDLLFILVEAFAVAGISIWMITAPSCTMHLFWWTSDLDWLRSSRQARRSLLIPKRITPPSDIVVRGGRLGFHVESIPLYFLYCYSSRTQCNGYRRWFTKLLRRQSSGGCRFNPDCRRVTIQDYLTFVSGYG